MYDREGSTMKSSRKRRLLNAFLLIVGSLLILGIFLRSMSLGPVSAKPLSLEEAAAGDGYHCLEECGIIVNRIPLPYDKKPASITSGIRLGTPIVTKNAMGVEEVDSISAMIDVILKRVKIISDTEYSIDESFREQMRDQVKELCSRFPMH